jgi:hypothetical protein
VGLTTAGGGTNPILIYDNNYNDIHSRNSEFKAATTLVADSSGTAVLRPSMSNVVGQGGLAQRVVPFELALYLILTTRSV